MTPVRYLFDTNTISATRRHREEPSVIEFVRTIPEAEQFVSVMTLGELWKGHALKDRRHPQGVVALNRWIVSIEASFEGRVIPVDARIAKVWGDIHSGRTRPVVDQILAATAIVHNMTMVTRNATDFEGLPLVIANPWVR